MTNSVRARKTSHPTYKLLNVDVREAVTIPIYQLEGRDWQRQFPC